jgi:hypothetical protein
MKIIITITALLIATATTAFAQGIMFEDFSNFENIKIEKEIMIEDFDKSLHL